MLQEYLSERECARIIIIIVYVIYSLIFIPFIFRNFLTSPPKMNKYYCGIHIIYVFIPIGLVGSIMFVSQTLCMVLITQIISIGNLFILYRCCKSLIKKHLEYLRYSNMVISGFLAFIILPFLSLIPFDKKFPESVFILLFLLPLFGLQVLYEKIRLSDEEAQE